MSGSSDLMTGLDELVEAREDYDTAWHMWRGSAGEQFDNPAVFKALARSAGKYPLNIAKIPVVALADRLRVSAYVALGPDGSKDEAADVILQDVVVAPNKLMLQTKRLIRNTLIFGDGYWFVWAGDTEGSVRVSYNDPRTTRAVYEEDSDVELAFVVRQWQEKGERRASLLYADRLELGWVLKDGAKVEDTSAWTRHAGAEDVPNPYGRCPVFHFRTDLPFGVPEHYDAYGPQAALQKMATTLAFSAEAAGLRGRYALTDPQAALNGDGIDNWDVDEDSDGDYHNKDDSRLRSGPAEMQVFTGVKAVGEWTAPDPKSFTDPADWFTAMAAKVTRTSSRYADPGGQHPSGAALRVADAPEAAKSEDRMEYLNGDLQEALQFAMVIAGAVEPSVDVRWKPSGLVDDVDTWAIVEAKQRNGVPQRVALAETGMYEQDEIDGWLADASVEMDVVRRVRVLGDLSYAIQGIQQGIDGGLLSDADGRQVLTTILGQLAPEVTPDGAGV